MLDALLNSTKSQVIKKSLDAQMLRARSTANVNPPGYKRTEVRRAFDSPKLKGTRTDVHPMLLGKGDVDHVTPEAYKSNDPALPSGVYNGDIEMARLAETRTLFSHGRKFPGHKKILAAIQGKPLTE